MILSMYLNLRKYYADKLNISEITAKKIRLYLSKRELAIHFRSRFVIKHLLRELTP